MSERSVAELMWTSKPCCNVEDGNGLCADDCKVWTSPDGSQSEYGVSLSVSVTVDDMLAWLREQEAETWFGGHSETPLTSSPVELCVIKAGQCTHRPKGDTLHAALEAAVRAVAEES